MCNILLFGGTTEGRLLVQFLNDTKIQATVCVTTQYGADLLSKSENLTINVGKKDADNISNLLHDNDFSLVIDATHPYALLATQNIKSACTCHNIPCYRLLREYRPRSNESYFDTIADVCNFLNCHPGNVLITTGSKELSAFCTVSDFTHRLTARVLPADGILDYCLSLGFTKDTIICEKGPFTLKQNISHLRNCNAKYIVTKDSGNIGGFDEKINAAKKCNAKTLIIKRPEEKGFSLEQIEKIILAKRNECKQQQ